MCAANRPAEINPETMGNLAGTRVVTDRASVTPQRDRRSRLVIPLATLLATRDHQRARKGIPGAGVANASAVGAVTRARRVHGIARGEGGNRKVPELSENPEVVTKSWREGSALAIADLFIDRPKSMKPT